MPDIRGYMRWKIWQLTWPVILEMLGLMLAGVFTTAMVGVLGPVALTAVGLANIVQSSTAMVLAAVGTGATAIVARSIGAREGSAVSAVAGQSLLLAALLGLVLAVAGYAVAPFFLGIAHTEPSVTALAVAYLRIVWCFAPPFLVMTVGNALLRGAGNTRLPFVITTVVNALTIGLGYMLIFGVGVPAVGPLGAAWALGLGQLLGGILVVGVLRYVRAGVFFSSRDFWQWDRDLVRRILRLSLPAAGEQLLLQGGRVVFTFMLVSVGAVQFAAHQIGLQVESISFLPGFGFAVAATTLVGQFLGRGLPQRAAQYVRLTNYLAVAGMTAMGVVFILFAGPLVRLFIRDPEVVYWGALCVRLAALEQPTIALTYVFGGALRGAGDTRWPFYVTGVGVWLIRLPLIYLFIECWRYPITAAWVITAVDFLIRSVILWRRFASNRWQGIRV